jgi:hypothetical protein
VQIMPHRVDGCFCSCDEKLKFNGLAPGVSTDRFCSARELCCYVAYFTVYHIAVSFTAVRRGCLESSLNRLGAIGASEGMSRQLW